MERQFLQQKQQVSWLAIVEMIYKFLNIWKK